MKFSSSRKLAQFHFAAKQLKEGAGRGLTGQDLDLPRQSRVTNVISSRNSGTR